MNESNKGFDKKLKSLEDRYNELTDFGREQDFDNDTEREVMNIDCQIKWLDEYTEFLLHIKKRLKTSTFYNATYLDSFEKSHKKVKEQAAKFYNIKQNFRGSSENQQKQILKLADIGTEEVVYKEETVFTNLKTYFNESKILSFNQFINESIENKYENPLQILLNDFSQNDETAKITNIKLNNKELNVAYTDKIFYDKTPKMKSFNDNKKNF